MHRLSHFLLSLVAVGVGQTLVVEPAFATEETMPAGASAPHGAADPTLDAADPAHLAQPAVPGGLTADQMAERVVRTSPGLRADFEDAVASEHEVSRARAAFFPRLTSALRYMRQSRSEGELLGNIVVAPANVAPGPLPPDTQLAAVPVRFAVITNYYEARTSLDVPLSDYVLRLPQLHAAAKKNASAAQVLLHAHRLRVAADARVAYYEWVRARLAQSVAERSLARIQMQLGDVRTARDVGTASHADVLSVEAQAAGAELTLARVTSVLQVQAEHVRLLMHDTPGTTYEIGEDLGSPTRSVAPGAPGESSSIRQALERRLELRALALRAASVREQASSERASELPRLSGFAATSYARPNSRVLPPSDDFQGSWEAGVQLSWSPSDALGASAGRAATEARARKLDAEREEAMDAIALEVKAALAALEESAVALRATERALAATAEAHRVRRELFKNGRATSTELSDAETNWSRAQLDAVSARADRRIAEVELAHAVGDDI